MNLLAQILIYVIQTLGTLFLAAIILRFFLQLARADFYNPFSQAIVKATNPVLIPLRRLIPGVFGIDIASIILALLVQFVLGEFSYFILYFELFNPLSVLFFAVLGTCRVITYIIYGVAIVVVVASFIAPYSSHPIILLCRQIIEPLTRPFQRLIPPVGGFDFSLLFVFMGNTIFGMILDAPALNMGLHVAPLTYLVIGY